MMTFHDIVLLIVVKNINVFDESECKGLVQTVGMFGSVYDAYQYRDVIMDTLEHGDSAVVIATNLAISAVFHDVLVMVDYIGNQKNN